MKYTYKGKDIMSLSHEELAKAAVWAFEEIQRLRNQERVDLEMQDLFEKTRTR